jgi:hypothetical protein
MIYHYVRKNGDKKRAQEARAFYTKLNKLGKEIQEQVILDWYKNRGIRLRDTNTNLFVNAINSAKDWEHVVDVLDRHFDPVAKLEFGYEVKPPLSKFLKPHQLKMASMIEDAWADKF